MSLWSSSSGHLQTACQSEAGKHESFNHHTRLSPPFFCPRSSMEFLDEESRPRFLFQSRRDQSPNQNPETDPRSLSRPTIFISVAISIFLISITYFLFPNSEPVTSILVWICISFLLGPFAPTSLTGGSISVGRGPILEPPAIVEPETVTKKNPKSKYSRVSAPSEANFKIEQNGVVKNEVLDRKDEILDGGSKDDGSGDVEEKDWNEEDFELLKKLMVKYPVGKLRRWEVITEAFNGRHKLESVVKMAKYNGDKRMVNGDDSFAQFLKNRKGLDKRVLEENELNNGQLKKSEGGITGETGWSSVEDIALLNALKTFPKDVPMRWEKISAAMKGKSKNACIKRVAELKKDFRSSKASTET